MPIKLLVTHAGDEGASDEYAFDQETVTIGRDGANHLTLPDPARIVSKQHAEIRDTGTGYDLVDLGSKNFTYLNGKRLSSDQPARLSPGDRFTVGNFEVQFYPEAAPAPSDDRTVFAASFVNPFEEPAEKLAASLGALRRVWGAEAGPHRADALRAALDAAMLGRGDEPGALVAAVLGGEDGEGDADAPQPAPTEPSRPPTPEVPPVIEPPPSGAPPFGVTPEPAAPPTHEAPSSEAASGETPRPAAAASEGRVERVLEALVEAASRLVSIPWQFRHEFIGQTIVQTDETAFLYETSPSELKALLLDERDPAEAERRLEAVVEAAEAVVVHQLAMLDGYKASVQKGAERLLGAVDPGPLEEEIEASSPVYKVPQLRSVAVLDRLKELHRELGGEDWSVAERRAFRPAFIKAYLARMTRRRT